MGEGNILLGMQEVLNENTLLREAVMQLQARLTELEKPEPYCEKCMHCNSIS